MRRAGWEADIRPLQRRDIERLRELTAQATDGFSELCAANLYLFRDTHAYRLSNAVTPHIRGVTYDGVGHVTPLQPSDLPTLLELTRHTALAAYPMAVRPGWASTYNPDDSDYLYRSADLATYAGAVRKTRRNLRAQFRRMADPRDENFETRHRSAALAVLDEWAQDVAAPQLKTDYDACREALALFIPLGLIGLITFAADGEPAGFLLASHLGDGSAAIHFAKGKRKFPGVFAHLFSRFAEMEETRFKRLNFEQDLGSPGLRQAKRSHGPIALLHKHRITPP